MSSRLPSRQGSDGLERESERAALLQQEVTVYLFRQQVAVTGAHADLCKVRLPTIDRIDDAPDFASSLVPGQAKEVAHRHRVLEGGVALMLANTHLLRAECLARRQNVKGGGQLILLSVVDEYDVVLLVNVSGPRESRGASSCGGQGRWRVAAREHLAAHERPDPRRSGCVDSRGTFAWGARHGGNGSQAPLQLFDIVMYVGGGAGNRTRRRLSKKVSEIAGLPG